MTKNRIHIAIGLVFVLMSNVILAQQGTSPVGVNWVLVNFSTSPTTVSVEQAPLKYNKDFALSMQMDDGDTSLYSHGFQVFEGGEILNNPGLGSYPGLTYSDGCGNLISFKMSAAIYSFNGNDLNGSDVHVSPGYHKILWHEIDTLHRHKWGILNHGVNGDPNTEPTYVEYSLKRNKSYIKRNLLKRYSDTLNTNLFVNINGVYTNWNQIAEDQGYLGFLNTNVPPGSWSPIGDNGGDVNNPIVDWRNPYPLKRRIAEAINVTDFVDQLAANSVGSSNYWGPIMTHSLLEPSWGYYFTDFLPDFNYIADTYGSNGLDNILMTTDEEILNYLIIRDATNISYTLNGNILLISFNGNVPDDLLYYSTTLVIESDGVISSIVVDGTDEYTFNGIGTSDALINIDWDGQNLPTDQYIADSMTTIATTTQHQYDCWVAMDYVIMLENGSHKDSLREVLCAIPVVVYDEGFCDCMIDLQPSDTLIMPGQDITLIAPVGDYDYLWYTENNTFGIDSSMTDTPVDTTTIYYLSATNDYGCPAIDSTIVTVYYLTIELDNDSTEICMGDSLELDGPENMNSYIWTGDGNTYSEKTIKVSPSSPTTYVLTVTDTLNGTASDSTFVDVLLLPTVDALPSEATIILGDSIDITGPAGMASYEWCIGETVIDSFQTTNVKPVISTIYHLVGTDNQNCTSIDSSIIYVHSLTIELEHDTVEICVGDSVVLEGPDNMITYEWTYNGSIDTTPDITISPLSTTIYNLTVTDSIGASASDSTMVLVHELPLVSILSPDTIDIDLGDSTMILGPNGFVSYQWFDPQTLVDSIQNTSVSPVIDTYYTLVAADSNSCEGEDSVLVQVTIQNLGPDDTICSGECVYMEGPTGYTSYVWYENDLVYSTGFSIEPCPIIDSEYKLIAVDGAGGVYQDSTMVFVLPTPTINLEPSDTTIVIGDSVRLYGAVGNYTWEWWVADTLYDTIQDIEVAPVNTTTYLHYAYNSDNCAGVDSIIVIVNEQFLGPDIFLCEGSCDSLFGPPNMMSYVWYENGVLQPWPDSEIEICPEETTEYVLRVFDYSGNSYQDTVIVNVVPLPDVVIQKANDTINLGDSLELYVQDFYETYQWYEEDTLLPDTTYSIFVHPELDSVQYTVIVTDTNQCIGEDSTYVYVNPLSFDLGPDDTLCQNQCYQLVGPPDMMIYNWFEGTTLLPYTNDTIEVCPTETTIYTLWVENGAGASAEDSITLYVLPSPTAVFESDTLWSCIYDNLVLEVTASEDADYFLWEFGEMDSITLINTVTFDSVVDSAYAYVLALAENECFYVDSVYVPVSYYPEITVSNDTTICSGDSIQLIASGGDVYLWVANEDTISMDSSVMVYPTDTIKYVAYTSFDSTFCFVNDTVTVSVIPSPDTQIIYDTTVICSNNEVYLEAEGADNYTWIPSGETGREYEPVITNDTTIYLIGELENGCTAMDSVSFTTIPSPDASIEPLLPAYCISDDAVVLSGSPEGGIFKGAGIIAGEFIPDAAGPGEHAVWYEVTDTENGCVGRDTTYTTVYGTDSEIDLGPNTTLKYTDTQLLDAGPGFDNYYWNTGATTQSITVTGSDYPTGTYEYVVMGVINGCSTPGNIFITFEGPDNIDEESLQGLKIYPNPNKGSFVLEFKSLQKNFDVVVYNMQGVMVYSEGDLSCNDDCTAKVILDGMKQGVYLLKIITPVGVRTAKIILK